MNQGKSRAPQDLLTLAELVARKGLRLRNGRAACPFHEASKANAQALSVDLERGIWKCHSQRCGLGGDAVDWLVADGATREEAVRQAGHRPRESGRSEHAWTGPDGGRIQHRVDHADGTKKIWWAKEPNIKPSRLVYLRDVGSRDVDRVWWCEGAKSADAIADAGFPAAAYVAAPAQVPDRETVLWAMDRLRRTDGGYRLVGLWPDQDAPGFKAARKFLGVARPKHQVLYVLRPGAPDKEDAADLSRDRRREVIAGAEEAPAGLASLALGGRGGRTPPPASAAPLPGAIVSHWDPEVSWPASAGLHRHDGGQGPTYHALEAGLADGAVTLAAGRLLADWESGRWFRWSGARWAHDAAGAGALAEISQLLTTIQPADADRNARRALASRQLRASVEALMQRDRRAIVTGSTDWDTCPDTLQAPGRAIALRSGAVTVPRPQDMLLRCCGTAPAAGEPRLWLRFLSEAISEDPAVIAYLQSWLGYALTGHTNCPDVLFGFGRGGNGKGVFMATLLHVWGDYAKAASARLFVQSHTPEHETVLANLLGARLVMAAEIPPAARWNEERVKVLSGSDTVSARFMRRDYFEFKPRCKLALFGNNKPDFSDTGAAMRRRLRLIEFNRRFGGTRHEDRHLAGKLRAEAGQILSWCIAGARRYSAQGTVDDVPASIVLATERYFEGADQLQRWIDEACDRDPEAVASGADLYRSYRGWCGVERERPVGRNGFFERLRLPAEPRQSGASNARRFRGVRVKSDQEDLI